MEMDFLRRLARCSRLEKKIRNIIREKMNIKNSVLDYIRYKQVNWYGHVQRIEDTTGREMGRQRRMEKKNKIKT